MVKKISKKVVKKNSFNYEIPSFVMGILSIVFAFVSPFAGLVLGIIGLVQSKKQKTLMSRKAKTMNIVGIVISAVAIISLAIFSYKTMGNFPAY